MLGHLLGAAGAVEAVAVIQAIQTGVHPPQGFIEFRAQGIVHFTQTNYRPNFESMGFGCSTETGCGGPYTLVLLKGLSRLKEVLPSLDTSGIGSRHLSIPKRI